MKFSENWLREWVNPAVTTDELVAQITLAGLEVDDVEAAAGKFSGVVVGEIIAAEPHPNADKLQVCTVSDGNEQFQVVCGAPNARPGIKVPFAKIGAVLGEDFKIKKAKLRQVESFGMLCSASELEFSDDNSGLLELAADAPVGEDISVYLGLDDAIIDVDLTPNRSDCLSIAGLAREVGVINKVDVTPVAIEAVVATHDQVFPVRVEAQSGCPRYVGRVIKGVDVTATTPLWMVEKLRRSGIRSIDPIVDVTNYVMLEQGQPMHAFDLANLSGSVVVRMAEEGEKLLLLDGQEIVLRADTMVIADEQKPLAMAGIMGGEHSGVNDQTQDIFLEAAFFAPLALAGKARSYGLHTDSSHRFERGVDASLAPAAIERATALIQAIAGGEAGPVVEHVAPEHMPVAAAVTLRRAKLDQYLATSLDKDLVTDILTRLGLEMVEVTDEKWVTVAPSHRFDIQIEADLIEEVARIYGYDNLPSHMPTAAVNFTPATESETPLAALRSVLVAQGYQEAVTYSFIDPVLSKQFFPEITPVPLENPISGDMGVMRTSLIPGLVKSYLYNQNRQQSRVRLFETGSRFVGDVNNLAELDQQHQVAGLIAGSRYPEGWYHNNEKVDFYDLKAHVEALFALNQGPKPTFERADETYLHPGRSAYILVDGEKVGVIGELHPQLSKQLGANQAIYVFEVLREAVLGAKLPEYKAVSKYPEVRRDLALLVDRQTPVSALENVIKQQAGEAFKNLTVFDVYQGQGIDESKKSVALGLTWQSPSHTLSDEETNTVVEQIVAALNTELGATIRG
ncbi:phenylalanine--tRNA ligase subunit beta [Maribrevibacterium harenarium]|uniref:Phenylalanine--tRNA ligase beta subunit n=1 Tax=Maribrevibacterium harenarium TaxID=2589817 RepID=A0A501WUV5_9GAMM|nr:phenylalanine--tRNA ligase subunit beta [Maribrevibacterium harenarium]TPE51954.1 phenylalanine--tRNA ligase subunit beta [Maribrevibacterium harenarium]